MDRLNFFTKKFMKKINKDNFKKTLSTFATGITVITTKYNSILYGKTINSFSSLSLSPPLVLFSLDNKSSKLNIFKKCETITINILSSKQQLVSNNFAKKNPDWKNIEYYSLKNGNPIIENCVSNLDCKIIDKIKKGDHVIFICQILKVINNDKLKPLIYYNSKYI
jgi:flavin reductase (DIM6/NTAB) family NADH-FMN oxidoreductase RutF